jgi:hypothetical protein
MIQRFLAELYRVKGRYATALRALVGEIVHAAPDVPDGTERRSALPRRPSPVSEENRTRQSGTREAAKTAGFDPKETLPTRLSCDAAFPCD